MATNWNDFTPVEPTAPKGGKVDWSQFEPIKPSDDGQMVSGFKRAFQEVPGLAAGVGAYAADVVGANDTRDALLGYAKRKGDEVAQQHANDAQSITDAWDGKVGWLDFLANASGYVAGQALQSIATGGLGALGARMVAKAGAKELAEAAAAKAIAAGATEQAAQAAARDAVVGSINKAMQRGGIAGAMGHNFGMELGSIYPDALEQAEKDGRTLDGGDKFRVLAAASLAAGVDTAGEAIMASRLLKGSGSQSGTFLGRAAREVPAGMAREAATEAVQTGIEQYGAAKPLDVREIVDAAGVGAVGGGLGGAVSARKTSAPTPRDVLAAPTVDDAIDKAAEAVSAPALQLAPRAAVQDGIPFEADPRFANVPTFGNGAAPKTPVFGSKQAADIHIGENDLLGRFEPVQVGDAWTIRQTDAAATAQSIQTLTNWMQRAQAMPKAKADDMVTQGREQLGKDLVAVPHTNGQGYTVVPRQWVTPDALKAITPERIPVGEVSEALPVPDATELEPIPTGEASELLPTGDAAELPKKIAAGKATEAAVETIHADDLLTQDQVPYGSRTAANLRARREGLGLEHVVEIPGAGWVIRPDLSVQSGNLAALQPVQAQPNGTRGTNAGDVVKATGREPSEAGIAVAAGTGQTESRNPTSQLLPESTAFQAQPGPASEVPQGVRVLRPDGQASQSSSTPPDYTNAEPLRPAEAANAAVPEKRASMKEALARRKRTLQEQVERPAQDGSVVATIGAKEPNGERKFYVTMVRGDRVARLAGPFDTKDEADAALPRARDEANQVDPRSAFDAFGVSAITSENHKPGALNERLGIGTKPADSTPAQEPVAKTAEAANAPATDRRRKAAEYVRQAVTKRTNANSAMVWQIIGPDGGPVSGPPGKYPGNDGPLAGTATMGALGWKTKREADAALAELNRKADEILGAAQAQEQTAAKPAAATVAPASQPNPAPAAPIQAQPNGTRGTNAGDVVKPVPAVPNVPAEPSPPAAAPKPAVALPEAAPAQQPAAADRPRQVNGSDTEKARALFERRGEATNAPATKPRVYKSRLAANVAKKAAGNDMRVKAVKGGFILRPATDRELAAAAAASRRQKQRGAMGGGPGLLAHVARLGGLDRQSAARDLGVSKDDFSRPSGIFGRPIFRQHGGKSAEHMLESLIEDNYLPAGATLRDLEDAVSRELNGGQVLPLDHDYTADYEARAQDALDQRQDVDRDVFANLTVDELESTGYTSASPEVQEATERLIADATAAGVDVEALAEDAAKATDGQPEDAYHAAFQAAIGEALAANRRGTEGADAGATRAGSEDRGQGDGGQEEGLTPAKRRKLEAEYQTRAVEVLQELQRRGDLPKLFKTYAGVRTLDNFEGLPIDEQADAYASYVEAGGKPVEFAESYNDKVTRMEREALVRRLQADREIRQASGKPFKTEASARQFQQDNDLAGTHEPMAADGGFVLRQLPPARQEELRRKAAGLPTYAEAAAAVDAEMGLGETAEGDIDATEAQFAERDRRIAARMRGEAPLLTAQTPADLKAKADREAAAEKAERAQKAADQERLRREAEARDNKARADATRDDFQLGQSAERQMSGMGDLFGGAAADEVQAAQDSIESLREKLRNAERDVLLAAPGAMGAGGGDIESAMRSRAVPTALKDRRNAARDALRAAQAELDATPKAEAASQPNPAPAAPAQVVASQPEPPTPATVAAQVNDILNAAAEPPKGKERLDVLKDAKAGAVTPEEVAAAFPPAEAAEEPAPAGPAPMPAVGGISMSLAQAAHAGTSFSPERRAEQERDSFQAALRDAWDRAARIAGADPAAIARITEVFSDVADGYRARYSATLQARSRVMSAMITGPAKFPVERNRKRMETERKRAEEASEYLARGIKRLIRAARGPIDNSPESELERVRLNLSQREEAQEQMKAANAALRKGDDAALEDLGFTAEQIAGLKKGNSFGDKGFPAYKLTNNNAEIRRLRERLKDAEARVAAAQSGPVETEREGVRVVEDATDDRLRLVFDGKPNEAVRDDLKANGFKWSPKNEAWQRQLTDNARAAARQVLDKHFPATREDDAGNVAMFSRAPGGEAAFRQALLEQSMYEESPIGWFRAKLDAINDLLMAEGYEAVESGNGVEARFWSDAGEEVTPAQMPKKARELAKRFQKVNDQFDAAEMGEPPQFFSMDATPEFEAMPRSDRQKVQDLLRDAIAGRLGMDDGAFSRSDTGPGLTRAQADLIAAAIRKALPGSPPIILHDSVSDAPASLRAEIERAGAESDVEAAYHQGEIHVFPGNIASPERMAFVVGRHEVRHHGLRTILGSRLGTTMLRMWRENPALRQAAQAKIDAGHATSRAQAIEEALADMAPEQVDGLRGFDRIVSAVRDWLRKMADKLGLPGVQWTDLDVAAMVSRAEDVSRSGGDGTAFSRAAQTEAPEFKRWFGNSKIVNDDGSPMVMYHGTFKDFANFDRKASAWRGESIDMVGSWFSSSPDDGGAGMYASGPGASVYPVYLRVERPRYFETFREMLNAMHEAEGRDPAKHTNGKGSPEGLRELLKSQGYDGIAISQSNVAELEGELSDVMAAVKRAKDEEWSVPKAERAPYAAKRERLEGTAARLRKELSIYDGSTEFDRQTVVIAFEPEQIKSAIGNAGTFDPESPDIRFSRAPANAADARGQMADAPTLADRIRKSGGGPKIVGNTGRQYSAAQIEAMRNVGFQVEAPTLEERAKALWQDIGKRMAQGIADQFAPVKEISEEAYGLLRLAKGASGAFETLLHGGKLKLNDGAYDFDEANKGGVIETLLKPLGGEHHDFFRWVAANRAERLAGEGKENLFSPEDIAALKTLASGTVAFDYTLQHGARAGQTTRDRSLIYSDALKTFNGFNKNVLDMAEQSGLIDGESRGLWEHEFYVPFYRVADEEDGGVRGVNIKGGVVRQQAFKQLKGGKEALSADLLDNTLMNWVHLIDASAKNRAAKATLEAAERMGAAIPVPESMASELAGAMGKKGNAVWFMDQGMKRHFVVEDPYLMTAISSLEYAGMRSPIMKALGAFKNALTVGVTASPFFKVRNLIRDSVQAIGTAPLGYNPLTNVARGWALTDPKSDAYFRLLAGGGTIHFGTMLEGSEGKRVQALVESGVDAGTILNSDQKFKAFYRKSIEPAITAYNELGNRGEAITRAALYDQLVKQGLSHREASLQARDLMDFSMQGSFTSVRFLAQVVPFFNARIQGLWKLGRAAKEDPARFSAVIGAATVASLALLLAYSDDEDWKKREDWDRNGFWWFKFGGTAFRIPKPFEIGAIASLAERGFELAFDKEMTNKRFRQNVLALLGDNLSMNPIPQLAKPLLDVYANKDSFTGRPIESMGMERLKSEYRFNASTSMTARGISTALNTATGVIGADAFSPVQVEHMLRGYFGWLGSFVVGAGDVLARPATGQPAAPESDLFKAATGGMLSDLRDAPSRYVSQMYQQATAIEQDYATWRELLKEGKGAEAAEFFRDNAQEIGKYHSIERVKKAEAELNKQVKQVELGPLSAAEKRERIRQILARKNQLARSLAPA